MLCNWRVQKNRPGPNGPAVTTPSGTAIHAIAFTTPNTLPRISAGTCSSRTAAISMPGIGVPLAFTLANTLGNIRYGVATARRAWVGPDRVANTREWPELDRLRKRSRS